eukprot:CAMPEP_0116039724 /NCGR_PEP_ID=MMETSP0321-20121206/23808_1 /TAXON_ID=163516 /ORGANISM="Leptocylindrus danicus var. danicus, Strain B650" /LENGTH=377 /DNA_ID=CAMNT_0003519151 /DNA_START=66 /DNA_END=1199 /DNA_ORIENTATION=+
MNEFNTAGLFNHTAAESLLQNLINAVQSHDHDIELIKTCLHDITDRLSRIEMSIAVPAMKDTIGAIVIDSHKRMNETMPILSMKADSADVRELLKAQEIALMQYVDCITGKLQKDLAHVEVVEELKENMATTKKKIDNFEAEVEFNTDQAEDTLRSHAKFVKSANVAITQLQSSLEKITGKLAGLVESNQSTHDKILNTMKEIDKRQDLVVLKERIRSLSLVAEDMTAKEEFLTVANRLKEVNDEMQQMALQARNQAKTIKSFQVKAFTKDEANRLNGAILSLRGGLSKTAKQKTLDELTATVNNLTDDYVATRRKAQLSAEFVEWYGKRGDAYEHNLIAVDGHLKQMAIKPKRIDENRQPTSLMREQVRKYDVPGL